MDIMTFMEAMGTSNIPIIAAFFIGLMMAISPCPMATNITAIAYISKKLEKGKKILMVGLFYAFGRTVTYVTIAAVIVWFGMNMQFISSILREYGEKLLGPSLILIGIVMLDILKLNLPGNSSKLNKIKEKLSKEGFIGSFLLGAIFSLAFCPFSAVLFFGMLVPLAIKTSDTIFIPAVFAIATSLPVIVFSLIFVYSVSTLSSVVNKVQAFERWMRLAVSIIFLLVGLYYTLNITLGVW